MPASLAFLEQHLGADPATLVAERRYGFAHGLVEEVLEHDREAQHGWTTGRLDALLTHRWLGIPIFIAIMAAMYTLTFVLGQYPQDWITAGFGLLHDLGRGPPAPGRAHQPAGGRHHPRGGRGGGVRAGDHAPHGLHLLPGGHRLHGPGGLHHGPADAPHGPARQELHPADHGHRLQRARRCRPPAPSRPATDRFITILVAPLVSCSARLQVYIVIAGTFFRPVQAAFAILAMHVLGFALAMAMGKLLRLTLFRGESAPFVMELPPYRLPVLKSTAHPHVGEGQRVPDPGRHGDPGRRHPGLVPVPLPGHHQPRLERGAASRQEAAVRALKLPPAEEKASRLDDLDLAHRKPVVNSSLAAALRPGCCSPPWRPSWTPTTSGPRPGRTAWPSPPASWPRRSW